MRINILFDRTSGLASGMISRALAIGITLFSSVPSIAQSQMIKDVNTTENPYVQEYSNLKKDGNGNIYFVSLGKELWKTSTNATPPSTIRLKVLRSISNLTVAGNTVFFVGEDGSGKELWKTNGTFTSTKKVKEIRSGTEGSDPSNLTNINGILYFSANNGSNGNELWKSDGTETGTVMVRDINPGSQGSDPAWMTLMSGSIYLAADGGANGRELWRTNGTASGTSLVKDIYSGASGSSPTNITNANGVLLFAAEAPLKGHELWTSNGTNAGTIFIKDINPGAASSRIDNMTAVGNHVYFSADDGTNGFELWKSNGTPMGTIRLSSHADYQCELDEYGEVIGECEETQLKHFEAIAGALYYVRTDPGSTSVYRVNEPDNDIRHVIGQVIGDMHPSYTLMGDYIYFFKFSWFDFKPDDPTGGEQLANQLYRMSLQGTDIQLVRAFYHVYTFDGGEPYPPRTGMITVNNQLYFPGILKDGQGYKMLRSTGTYEGTQLVRDTYYATLSSNPRDLITIHGITIFTTGDNVLNNDLWRTDGTSAGTYRLMEFKQLVAITASANSVYVIGARSYGQDELWKTDGTRSGTVLLKQFETSSFGFSYTEILDVYGIVYFVSDQGELWKSNGTSSGTVRLRDFDRINYLGKGGGRAIFSATIAGRHELWRSSGTINSTAKLRTIHTNPHYVTPLTERVTSNDIFYFVAESSTHGHEVWRSDGTTNGTYMLKDIRENDLSEYENYHFAAFRDSLYFTAETGGNQYALYKSDGTTAGTIRVADVPASFEIIPADDYLTIFTHSTNGLDLWSTRGTTASTKFIMNLEPTHFFSPSYAVTDGITYFTSDRTVSLWRTDGTECGTFSLNTPEYPYPLVLNGTQLIFGAYTPRFGREPHRLSLLDVPSSPCAKDASLALSSRPVEVKLVEYGPNPFTEKVTIKINDVSTGNVSIAIKAFTGEIVHKVDYLNVDGEYVIGENWPKGLYVVDISINGKSQSFRLLKK